MDHAVVGTPARPIAETLAPRVIVWPELSDTSSSTIDPWLVLFDRARGRSRDEADPGTSLRTSLVVETPHLWDVLAAWRAADRELAGLAVDDSDWNRVHAEMVGLRELHHRLFAARLAQDAIRGETTIARFADAARAWLQDAAPASVPVPAPATA